jgi:CO dehydrogenase/acetyl-CoA synthase gamma subunit (corrinoid Fe-S protein)
MPSKTTFTDKNAPTHVKTGVKKITKNNEKNEPAFLPKNFDPQFCKVE